MAIYTSLSGAISQGEKLDVIANNISNANTPAFKKDRAIFKTKNVDSDFPGTETLGVPSLTSQFQLHKVRGNDLNEVKLNATYTDFKQGVLKETGRPLDFGLEGEGFFEVLTPRGVRLTRNGHFKLDRDGRLVNASGFPVLLQPRGGALPSPTQRVLQLRNARSVSVSEDGKIYSGRNLLGNFSLVSVDPNSLKKEGHSLYTLLLDDPSLLRPSTGVKVLQGFIEGSNVNVVEEMTDMIQATRAFESNQKMVKAYDLINDKLVNQVSKLR